MTKKAKTITGISALVVVIVGTVIYGIADREVQRWLCTKGIEALRDKLQTRIEVDSISVDLLSGELYLYGFEMDDRKNVTMLKVDTMGVNVEMTALLDKDIVLQEVKMHGATAILYKERKDTAANYQFVLDAFKPKKKKKKNKSKTEIEMNLEQAHFSRLNLDWDVKSERQKGGDSIDTNHLRLRNMHLKLEGEMQHKRTLDVTASALRIEEEKSGAKLSLEKAQYRTIGGKTHTLLMDELAFLYKDKRLRVDRMSAWQSSGTANTNKSISVHIDSLRYFCNNGKPRKNHNRPNRGAFDKGHLDAVVNLDAEVHHAGKDSITGVLRHMDGIDKGSGLIIKDFSTFFNVHNRRADLTMVKMKSTRTTININKVSFCFPKPDSVKQSKDAHPVKGENITILPCRVTADVYLQDIAQPFAPPLSHFTTPLQLTVDVDGSMACINLHNIYINTKDSRLRLTAEGNIRDVLRKHVLSLHFWDIHLSARSGIKEQIVNHFAKKVNLKMMKQMKALGDIEYAGTVDLPYKHEDIAGILYSDYGNVSFSFDINNYIRYLNGTMFGNNVELGRLMNVKGLGPITAHATYSFNIASKRKMREMGHDPGKLPIGTLKANIDNVSYKKLSFHNISTELVCNGTVATGVVSTSVKAFDVTAEFEYKQTDREQSWKVKPHLAKHALSLKEIFAKKKKDKEKEAKKAEKKARKDAANEKRQEMKSIFSRIKDQIKSMKKSKNSSESSENTTTTENKE